MLTARFSRALARLALVASRRFSEPLKTFNLRGAISVKSSWNKWEGPKQNGFNVLFGRFPFMPRKRLDHHTDKKTLVAGGMGRFSPMLPATWRTRDDKGSALGVKGLTLANEPGHMPDTHPQGRDKTALPFWLCS